MTDLTRKIPVIPKLPYSPYDVPPLPSDTIAICGECGLELKQVMGYVCVHPRCPTGLGGPTCG